MESLESLMTSEDVAQYLNVDIVTVRRLVSRGELAAYRVGAEYRFALSDLQAYLKQRYMPAGARPDQAEPSDKLPGPAGLLTELFAPRGQSRSRTKPAVGERFTERA